MRRVPIAVVSVALFVIGGTWGALASADPDPGPTTTVIQPPPVPIPTELTPPPITVTLPPPPPPVTTTVTAPPLPPVTVTAPPPPPVTSTVTLPPPPPVTTTVTVTPTTPPAACGGPINITTGGSYSGCYQSNNVNTPAVTISTTQPVTLSRAHIVAKGNGVWIGTNGVRLTVVDSVFDQQDPGTVAQHRAVLFNNPPASLDFQHNTLNDTDGIFIGGAAGGSRMDSLVVNYNSAVNVGRYPHPTDVNCCVQFLQLASITVPGGQVLWNHTRNVYLQSGAEDNISFYISGGTDSTHRIDVGFNLIDGAYPRANCQISCGTTFTGGGINLGDGGEGSGFGGGGHSTAHDNTVISTTNYGISVNGPDNYATNNLLVNDGAEQVSEFGNAFMAWPEVSPPGLHATNNRYNWHRSLPANSPQWPCYVDTYCGNNTAVATTEQQARDGWDAARAVANVVVGPRP